MTYNNGSYARTRRLERTANWAIDKFGTKENVREWLVRYEGAHGSCIELHRILKARFAHFESQENVDAE